MFESNDLEFKNLELAFLILTTYWKNIEKIDPVQNQVCIILSKYGNNISKVQASCADLFLSIFTCKLSPTTYTCKFTTYVCLFSIIL